MSLRLKTQHFMELARPEDRASHWLNMFMVALILANVLASFLTRFRAFTRS